ncbi:MAG TPA: choice-of-anchor Q domain-containing protein [Solirubrobacterales bacterium]|nr:choice-of-anchor Q domain-containing protein [Solirubrobacterales bacterium]
MRTKSIPVACAIAALALIAPAAGQAATFTVNTTADTTVAGGCTTEPSCSLRDAVIAATASKDAEDVIVVPAGNYGLENGQLEPGGEGSLLIRGAGARSTVIDAHGTSRVFDVAGDVVTIEGLTVTGGVAPEGIGGDVPGDGGGILAFEVDELFLDDVTVSGNTAALNGGGISAPPEGSATPALTITDSTFVGNKVAGLGEGLGGGIYVLGDLTLVNSTVTGNSVESTGVVQGGGIVAALDMSATEPSEVEIVNSTIAGNSLGSAGAGAGLSVVNPTPGVVTELSVKNTIVAGNTGPMGESNCGTVAMLTSDHNLSSDGSCMFTDAGSKENVEPQLGPLQNNGGETDTLALPAGSPAVDAGTDDGCPATDQRGISRPQGSACDIGAFELEQGSSGSGGGGSSSPPPSTAATAADLRLQIKAKPKAPRVGGKLAFLITVTNKGPATATGAIVKGTVPALAGKAKAPKLNGKKSCKLAKAKNGKRQLTCRLGDLAAGATKKVKVVVRTAHAGKVKVRARVRSGVADPNLKDNRATRGARIRS